MPKMKWPDLQNVMTTISVPEGVRFESLHLSDCSTMVTKLSSWFPDITVGSESCHLNENYYAKAYFLEGSGNIEDHDGIALKATFEGEIIGLLTFTRDVAAETLTSHMGAVDPNFRGAGMGYAGPQILESTARAMGAGLAYYFTTLKHPYTQKCAEKCGFKLVGIVPAFDRDMISPKNVKRVYEAIYAKCLSPDSEIFTPPAEALTPNTKALFDFLFMG